jgi:cytoskeletal protein CcmA (bactofilin family)
MLRVVWERWGILMIASGLLGGGPLLAETRFSDSLVVTQAIDDDLYAVAGEVRIEGAIGGAAALAAGSAQITGDVEGDVMLAGGRINLAGGAGDDLRAAGGEVQVTGFVTDQATIAGGTVTIGPGSAIGGRTWIAGGDVEMAGQIGDNLRVLAGTVVISGQVVGNAEITAREIRVAPGAVIGGDLLWRSNQPPIIAEDAQIMGEVRASGGGDAQSVVDGSSDRFAGSWTFGIAVAAAALVLHWFAPQLAVRSAGVFQAAPGRTLVLGAASLVLTPIIALVLFVTVLGWLLGLVVLAGYVFGVMLSGLLGLLIVVRSLRDRIGVAAASGGWSNLAVLLLVVFALVLAQQVPLLGRLISLLLVLAGFGALTALVTGRAPRQSSGLSKGATGQSAG